MTPQFSYPQDGPHLGTVLVPKWYRFKEKMAPILQEDPLFQMAPLFLISPWKEQLLCRSARMRQISDSDLKCNGPI